MYHKDPFKNIEIKVKNWNIFGKQHNKQKNALFLQMLLNTSLKCLQK